MNTAKLKGLVSSARRRFGRRGPFFRLAARRILLLVPTFFGISLVLFAALNLAVGDDLLGSPSGPGSLRSGRLTRQAEENLRRTYGLDLPLFFNGRISDRSRRVADALLRLRSKSAAKAEEGERRCTDLATLILPEAVASLDAAMKRADGPVVARLKRVLNGLLARMKEPDRDRIASMPDSSYLEWWRAAFRSFRPSAIREAAAGLASGSSESFRAILWLHRKAVPELMRRLLRSRSTDKERSRLSRALSEITGHVVVYDPKGSPSEKRSALGQWRDFWRSEEVVYRDLGAGEKIFGFFTRTRFAMWLTRIARGDFGQSHYYRKRAWDVIMERLPATLGLSLAALLLSYLISIPLGVWSAAAQGSLREKTVTTFLFVLYSMPAFWVALLLILFLGGVEGPDIFPTSGLHSFDSRDYPAGSALLDLIWHSVLPVFCLTYGMLAVISRYQKNAMVGVLSQDYIRTARAKGLSERSVVWKHGLRNGIVPMVNLMGLHIPYLISGSVIVESIFDINGMGLLTLVSIQQQDINVLMGIVSLTAILTLLGMLVSDLLMLWADPRISFDRREGASP